MGNYASAAQTVDDLPFHHRVEVYQDEEGDVRVFTLRLEQPFLADEFEQSNYLRLRSSDDRAYLIYPQETQFRQKHAEFYGRLRGTGTVQLELAYETVSENLDGSRRVEVRSGSIEVEIPTEPTGPPSIFMDWARQQNSHFARLLSYYPHESFFQYCVLQSRARYGVKPPKLPQRAADREALETNLYEVFTGSLAIQESLQHQALSGRGRVADLDTHISTLRPPELESLPYETLLEEQREDGVLPTLHDAAALVPADQYFLHFRSMQSLSELLDLSTQWSESLLRPFRTQALDQRLEAKLEEQLCLRRVSLTQLSAAGAIADVTLTGADPFVLEGADVTVILRLVDAGAFDRAAQEWLATTRVDHPELVERQFNYRGHRVAARYTNDRVVSSFVVRHADYVVFSSSHRAIRNVIDAAIDASPSVHDALDYQYVTTIMPPSEELNAGYLFASEAFLRRMIGPRFKISEKRRMQCFNNLVMLNNASLFYRLEYGRSPETLSDLVTGRFVDATKVVCPHGGTYAFDAEGDMCTCALHNRLKYLTPNTELTVQNVSKEEAAEYTRYKERYGAFWRGLFDPVAMRITVGPRLRFETCILPFANGPLYRNLRSLVEGRPQPLDTTRIAPSAFASLVTVLGRERIADVLKSLPGMSDVLRADPNLTDLTWIGDRVSLHFCDAETILEIDPVRLRPLNLPFLGDTSIYHQGLVAMLVASTSLPVYVTIDVEDTAKAASLLDQMSQQLFLTGGRLADVTTAMDGYRLPDYREHAVYVFSGRLYAFKVRLHVALVDDQLVAATRPEVLHEVIDAHVAEPDAQPVEAHLLLRLNHRALDHMYADAASYWAEKSRLACHKNTISIYNLHKLYDAPLEEVPRLSEAKYGVRYRCPDHGRYEYDAGLDQVLCSLHGNRERSRQSPHPDGKSSFDEYIESIDEIVATLRFEENAALATVEVVRSEAGR